MTLLYQRLRSENADSFCSLCVPDRGASEERLGQRRRSRHLERKFPEGVDGTIAIEPDGQVAGLLVFVPIETCGLALEGRNLNVIQCLHVRKDCRRANLATELMAQSIHLSCDKDGLAVVAWKDEDHFPTSFFSHFAFRTVDTCGPLRLMVRQFRIVQPPRWTVHEDHPELARIPQGHELHLFDNLVCGQNLPTLGRMCRVAEEMAPQGLRTVIHEPGDTAGPRSPCFEVTSYLDGRLLTAGPVREAAFRDQLRVALTQGGGIPPRPEKRV